VMTTRKLITKNSTIRLAIRVRIAAHGPAWQTDGRVEQGGYLGPDRAGEGPEETSGCAGAQPSRIGWAAGRPTGGG